MNRPTLMCWMSVCSGALTRARVLSIALSATLLSCGDSPTGPSSGAVNFAGRVLDYATQSPVPNASVTFTPASSESVTFHTISDANGSYSLTVLGTGMYGAAVDGRTVGSAYVNGSAFRGDLFVDRGTCIARYGLVIDSKSLKPIRNATIFFGTYPTTDANGWYRLDLECPVTPPIGGGTTAMTVSHPDYFGRGVVLGRGVSGVFRLDVTLDHR